jgi:hypothetical protein
MGTDSFFAVRSCCFTGGVAKKAVCPHFFSNLLVLWAAGTLAARADPLVALREE